MKLNVAGAVACDVCQQCRSKMQISTTAESCVDLYALVIIKITYVTISLFSK